MWRLVDAALRRQGDRVSTHAIHLVGALYPPHVTRHRPPPRQILHVLEPSARAAPSVQDLCELVQLVQSVTQSLSERRLGLDLAVITSDTQLAERASRPPSAAGAANGGVWGFSRTLQREHPSLRSLCADVSGDGDSLHDLAALLCADAAEAQRIGLVRRVLPDDELMGAVEELAGPAAWTPRGSSQRSRRF